MESRVRARTIVTLAALWCATAVAGAQEVTVSSDPALAKLQRRVATNPGSVSALRAVGVKFYELNRFQEARTALDHARQLDPNDGVSALYSGLAAEGLNDYTAAKQAYTRYLEIGKTKRVREQISARLVALAKDELKASAKQAVANEQQLRGAQSPGTTIAVLPFKCSCADTSLLPLERGLADLVVTDLSRASALTVLERDRMQAIADEIRLSQSAQVDAATATRAGKLIAAGSILNSQIIAPSGSQISLAGAVVNTNTASVTSNPQATGTLEALFNLERDFVLDVFSRMGVTLLAAERAEFDRRRVPSLQAFLAYSRGLMAEDDGRLDDAITLFESARTLDPGFGAALQRAQSAAAARSGAQFSSATVQQGLRNSAEGQIVSAAQRGSTTDVTLNITINNAVGDINPTTTNVVQSGTTGGTVTTSAPQTRDATSEKTGADQPAIRTGQVTIVIRKP